jgi:hypothetical protein
MRSCSAAHCKCISIAFDVIALQHSTWAIHAGRRQLISQLHDWLPCLFLHRAFRAARPSVRAQTRLLRPLLLAAAAPWGSRAWTCPSGWQHCSRRRLQALLLHCRCAVMWVLYHLLAGHKLCRRGFAVRLTRSWHHGNTVTCCHAGRHGFTRDPVQQLIQKVLQLGIRWTLVPLRLWPLRLNTPGSLAQCLPGFESTIKTQNFVNAGAAAAPAAADA